MQNIEITKRYLRDVLHAIDNPTGEFLIKYGSNKIYQAITIILQLHYDDEDHIINKIKL